MSTYAMISFKSGRETTTDTPASIDPAGGTVYGQNLPASWDKLNAMAEKLRVTRPDAFCYESPEEMEEFIDEMDEASAAEVRGRLASQKMWHPIADGLKTFEALRTHYGEPPSKAGGRWSVKEGIAWDLMVFVAVLREAVADGEREFHIEIY